MRGVHFQIVSKDTAACVKSVSIPYKSPSGLYRTCMVSIKYTLIMNMVVTIEITIFFEPIELNIDV